MNRKIAALMLSLLAFPAFARSRSPVRELDAAKRAELEARAVELRAAAAADPKQALLWKKLGFLHQALGDAEASRAAFERFSALAPEDASGHFMLGLVYEKLKLNEKAIASWEKCLRFAKKEKHRETARRHLALLRGS